MKTSGIITTIGIVIILIIAGLALFRGAGEEGISPDPTPPNTIESADDTTGIFEQEADFEPQFPSDGNTQPDSALDSSLQVDTELNAEGDLGATSETTVTIALTDTGVSTTELEIDRGTTVTFVNNGQAAHWPASDVHPTHEILPDFDSKRGLATGETYSYTFNETGTWRFHDHLNPSTTGVIVVR